MKRYQSRRGAGSTQGQNQIKVSTQMMLDTYVKSNILLNFVDNGRQTDVEDMEVFIDSCKQRRRYAYIKRNREDKGGLLYKYVNFIESNGPEGAKVVLLDNIEAFISDYHKGKVTIDFTFDDLVAEAEKV